MAGLYFVFKRRSSTIVKSNRTLVLEWARVGDRWWKEVSVADKASTTKSKHTEKTTSETPFFGDKVSEIQPEAPKFSVAN